MAKREFSIGFEFIGDGTGLENTVKSLSRTMDKTTLSMVGMALKAIPVAAALKGITMAMNQTEAGSDKLKEITEGVSGAFQGFFRTVTTGDWDKLISNITNTAKATRDLAFAKDELQDFEASDTVRIGYLERSLQAARLAAMGTADPAEKKRYIEEAKGIQKSITAIEVEQIAKRLKITEDFFTTREQWTKQEADYNIDQIRKIAGNYEYWFGDNSVAIEVLKARVHDLQGLRDIGMTTGFQLKELNTSKLTLGTLDIFKSLQNTMKPDEFREYIKMIGDFNAAIAKGDEELRMLERTLTAANTKLSKFSKESAEYLYGGVLGDVKPIKGGNLKVAGNIEQISTALQQQMPIVDRLSRTFEQMFLNVGGGFKGMMKSMTDSLKLFVAELAAKAALIGILNLISGGTGNFAFTAMRAASAMTTNLRGQLGIPGYAGGTGFAPGGLALVGEHGPELVNLPRGSRVSPNLGGFQDGQIIGKLTGRDFWLMYQRNAQYYSFNG